MECFEREIAREFPKEHILHRPQLGEHCCLAGWKLWYGRVTELKPPTPLPPSLRPPFVLSVARVANR